nr:sperm-associated antigen 8 isoform X2 [Cavia porcellus]
MMDTTESTQGSQGSGSGALDDQPSSEGLSISEPFLSSDVGSRSDLTAAAAAAAAAASAASSSAAASINKAVALCSKTPESHSEFTEPSSDSLRAKYAGSHQAGLGSLDFEPAYDSSITEDLYITPDLSSGSGQVTDSSSRGPAPVSSIKLGSSYVPGSWPGPGSRSVPGSGLGPGHDSGQGSWPVSGTGPGSSPGPEVSPSTPQRFRNLKSDLLSDNIFWSHHCHWEPPKEPSWEFLKVSEPGALGLRKPQDVEGKPQFHYGPLSRGRCLLYNWEEERATNHLDQVPSSKDGSESYFFRHGHQGLLSILQSPVPSTTTQKDSYQPPRNLRQPLRGKREAILEMLLYHQICKEVQAEQDPPRKLFEVQSVTHHDYQMKLAQTGPPAPTKVRTHPTPLVQLGSDRWASPEVVVNEGQRAGVMQNSLPNSLMTTVWSSLKPSGYKGHHSYRYVIGDEGGRGRKESSAEAVLLWRGGG